MHTWRERRGWAGWLAVVVIGLAMLVPTVARVLAQGNGAMPAGWVEVCTASGIRWVQLDSGESRPDDGLPVLEQCPLCLLAWDRLAPPPTPIDTAALLRADLTQRLVAHRAPLLRAATHALAGRPRGPPSIWSSLFVA